jgi:hypothetical protein
VILPEDFAKCGGRAANLATSGLWFTAVRAVDEVAEAAGIEVKETPFQAPKANAYCERLIGTTAKWS